MDERAGTSLIPSGEIKSSLENSKTAYLKLIGKYLDHIPNDEKELPTSVTLPPNITNDAIDILKKTIRTGREHNGNIINSYETTEIKGYLKDVAISFRSLEKSILGDPDLMAIHSHTSGDSSYSGGDVYNMRVFPRQAYSYLTVAENNASLIVQTEKTLKVPLSSVLNAIVTLFSKDYEPVEKAERELAKLIQQKRLLNKNKSFDVEEFQRVAHEYGSEVAGLFTKLGYGYYVFDGKFIDNQNGEVTFNRVIPEPSSK